MESVIEDCGAENRDTANLLLYVLTDENNTRPPKTRSELETDLKALEEGLLKDADQIDLILYIFQKSGLVVLIPEIPSERYQLVHDYLVSFIRAKQPIIERIITELKIQREALISTQEKLRISELEKEIYKTNKIKLEREAELKKLRYRSIIVTVSSMSIITIAFIFSFLYFRFERSSLKAKMEKEHNQIQMIETRLISAEILLPYDKNQAIFEILVVADNLSRLEPNSLRDQKVQVIRLFQEAFQSDLLSTDDFSKSEEMDHDIEKLMVQEPQILTLEELNEYVDDSIKFICHLLLLEKQKIDIADNQTMVEYNICASYHLTF